MLVAGGLCRVAEVPTVEDVRGWLVEDGQTVAFVRHELRLRGLSPQMAGQLIARALRSLEQDDAETPLPLRRARLRHAMGQCLSRGDWRGYRVLAADLEELTPLAITPPDDLSPDARRQLMLQSVGAAIEGRASAARLAPIAAAMSAVTQIDYAEAAGRAAQALEELQPVTDDIDDTEATARIEALLERGKA